MPPFASVFGSVHQCGRKNTLNAIFTNAFISAAIIRTPNGMGWDGKNYFMGLISLSNPISWIPWDESARKNIFGSFKSTSVTFLFSHPGFSVSVENLVY